MKSLLNSRFSFAHFACVMAAAGMWTTAQAQLTNYTWQGDVSSDWSTAGNWTNNVAAPTGGVFVVRLDVTNRNNSPLRYTAAQGYTYYSNGGLARGFTVGSGASGTMIFEGGTFSTVGNSQSDIIGNGNSATGTVIVAGGTLLGTAVDLGLGGGTGRESKLIISNGFVGYETVRMNSVRAQIDLINGTLRASSVTSSFAVGTFAQIFFNGGTLQANANNTNWVRVNGGTLIQSNGAIIDSQGYSVAMTTPLRHATNAGEAAIDGGLVKLGTGTLAFSEAATNNYTGITDIREGTIELRNSTALGSTLSGTLVSNGARVVMVGGINVTNEALTLNGTAGGTGALRAQSGSNTWSGAVTLGSTGVQISANTNATLVLSGAIDDGASSHALILSNAIGGVTVLQGAHLHDGGTTVRGAGRVDVTGSLESDLSLDTGATLGGEGSTAGTLTFAGTNTFRFDGATPGAFSANSIVANGNQINVQFVNLISPTNGILVLSSASAISATIDQFDFVGRGDLSFAAGDTQLLLDYSGPVGALLWQGTGANPTFWDNHITTNWLATSAEKFYSLDEVIFDDSASTFDVAIQGASVTPLSVVFSNSANAYTLSGGAIAGATPLIMAGTNVTTLANANTYTGQTIVSNGALRVANNTALGLTNSGTIVNSGARLELASNVTVTGEGLVLSGNGNGLGALRSVSGSNAWAQTVTLNADGVQVGAAAGATLNLASGVTDGVSSFGLVISNAAGGTTVLSGTGAFDSGLHIQDGTVIVSSFAGLGTARVTNDAILNLVAAAGTAGATSYTGLTNGLSGSGTVNVTLGTNTATLTLGTSAASNSAFTGVVNVGIGAQAGAGKMVLNSSLGSGAAINVLTNATLMMNAGTTQIASLVLHGGDTGESHGQLRIEAGATWAGAITIAGAITGTNDGHIGGFSAVSGGSRATITGSIGETNGSQDLVKSGQGLIILAGSNSYSGATLVRAGGLRASNDFAFGTSSGGVDVGDGARVELMGGFTIANENITIRGGGGNFFGALQSLGSSNTWTGNVLIDQAGTRIGASNGTLVLSGVIDDGANVYDLNIRNASANGVTVLSGANTYQGTTFVSAGVTRLLGGDNRLPVGTIVQVGISGLSGILDIYDSNQEVAGITSPFSAATQLITNSNLDVTNTLTVNSVVDTTYGGAINGGLALVKSGAGTFTLNGASSYSGNTTVSNGTLVVNGQLLGTPQVMVGNGGTLAGTGTVGLTVIDNGGHLAPGTSPGVLHVTNSLTLNPTSQLDFEIGAITNARSYYDVVQVSGTPGDLVLDGVLNISNWAGGFGATSGTNVYALFDYTGTLSDNTVELGNVPTNLAYRVQTDVPGRVDLSVKEFAQASFTNDVILSTLLLDFGVNAQAFSSNVLAFSIFSFDTNAVRLALSLTNFDGAFGPFSIAGANFSGLGGGSNQLFSAILDLSTAGIYSNSFTFSFTSTADGYLFAGDGSHQLTITMIGEIQIPEPGAAAALLAVMGLVPRRRRTRA
jgi:autotransporter-associated beta strand protein